MYADFSPYDLSEIMSGLDVAFFHIFPYIGSTCLKVEIPYMIMMSIVKQFNRVCLSMTQYIETHSDEL